MAVLQLTEPLATLMTTGTPTAVCVLPQDAPAVACPDEHPVIRQAPARQTPRTHGNARARRAPSRSTVSP
jgi:hypothetical protein